MVHVKMLSSLRMLRLVTGNQRSFAPVGRMVVGRAQSTSQLGKDTYGGPYTDQQVYNLEKFAYEVLRKHEPSKKLVDPWLRAKLGPYYKEFWQQRVAARNEEEKKQVRIAARPPISTHFTVTHPLVNEDASKSEESKDVFAIIGLAGTQYKVTTGDVVICNKLPGA